MNDLETERIRATLEEILKVQREQLALIQQQHERAEKALERQEKIQARAEFIQENAGSMMKASRKILAFVIPVILLLVVYLSWLIFARR